jgi:hypothetical protein
MEDFQNCLPLKWGGFVPLIRYNDSLKPPPENSLPIKKNSMKIGPVVSESMRYKQTDRHCLLYNSIDLDTKWVK